MAYETIENVPVAINKKKRVNRSAKLKQSKLDVRREQWLSQVKNKGVNCAKMPVSDVSDMRVPNVIGKAVVNSVGEENEGLMNAYSDWDSPSNSPTSGASSLLSNRSVLNFVGSSRSSSSSGGFCYSESMTDDGEGDADDGCLDDWEAIADALAADDVKNERDRDASLELQAADNGTELNLESQTEMVNEGRVDQEETEKVNCRAWRPDDAFRPQGLPNLLKQNSLPMNLDRRYGGGSVWGFKNVGLALAPLTCPICCEDLDLTDSSFLPCPCGYRLCLFCYKRIIEDNGRCPGCRKQYEQGDQGSSASKLARSYSMIPRR